jgi:hypothetical protein
VLGLGGREQVVAVWRCKMRVASAAMGLSSKSGTSGTLPSSRSLRSRSIVAVVQCTGPPNPFFASSGR